MSEFAKIVMKCAKNRDCLDFSYSEGSGFWGLRVRATQ